MTIKESKGKLRSNGNITLLNPSLKYVEHKVIIHTIDHQLGKISLLIFKMYIY